MIRLKKEHTTRKKKVLVKVKFQLSSFKDRFELSRSKSQVYLFSIIISFDAGIVISGFSMYIGLVHSGTKFFFCLLCCQQITSELQLILMMASDGKQWGDTVKNSKAPNFTFLHSLSADCCE